MQFETAFQLVFRSLILTSLRDSHMAGSRVKCGVKCSLTSECYSYFYDIADGRCFLVDGYVRTGGSGTSARDQVVYYAKPSAGTNTCRTDTGYQEETSMNICYKIYLEERKRGEARSICQSEGGDLATAKTSQIQNFYINLLGPYGEDMFLGAYEDGTSGSWKWIDGTPWPDFTQSVAGKQCLIISEYGTFDVEECTDNEYFVCEIVMSGTVPTYS